MVRSWMIGHMVSDALASAHADCEATILVRTGHNGNPPASHPAVSYAVDDSSAAGTLWATIFLTRSSAEEPVIRAS